MKVYEKDKNGDVLFHSDTYLGEDYTSSNLKHWKYLKKEKVNGKWVYYYTTKELEAKTKKTGIYVDKSGNSMPSYNTKITQYDHKNGLTKTSGDNDSDYGTYEGTGKDGKTYNITVKKSNKLFSSEQMTVFNGKTHQAVIEVGLLKQSSDALKKKVAKGVSWLKKLFK